MGCQLSRTPWSACDEDEGVIAISDAVVVRIMNGPSDNDQLMYEDQVWLDRLQCISDNHSKRHHLRSQDFDRTIKLVERLFSGGANGMLLPCTDNNIKVLRCYNNFPNETLNCSQEVKAFSACVEDMRVKMLSKHKITQTV